MRSLFDNVIVSMWMCVGIGALASEVLSLKALAAAEKYKAALKDPTLNPEEFKDEDLFEIVKIEKLFTEYCRSDVDLNQINYALQSFVDAVHSRPAPIRASKCSGALSLLSDCFAITELLSKLPSHIDTIVVCCPPYFNIVPWHLLLIEDFQPPADGMNPFGRERLRPFDVGVGENSDSPGDDPSPAARTMHVMEQYVVRLGNSVPMMEVTSNQSAKLTHQPGAHKLCFIDTDHDATTPLSDAESTSVRSLWSSDPWDYSLLHGTWACAERLCTKLHTKRDVVSATNPRSPGKGSPTGKGGRPGTSSGRPSTSSGRPKSRQGRGREGGGKDGEDDTTSVDTEEEEGQHRTSQYLAGCRVLHLSALWQVEPIHPRTAAYLSSNERAVKGEGMQLRCRVQ